MNEPTKERLAGLKERAFALSRRSTDVTAIEGVSVEVTQLLEDLRIHQIELELQNEELRATQQDLALSQRRYQAMFNQMPLPALVVDPRGLIDNCNELAALLLGGLLSNTGADNRLFQGLGRDDRMRLHMALREVRHGEPLVLSKLAFTDSTKTAHSFDLHLIQLSLDYHLDTRVLVLLVDQSAQAAREKDQRFFSQLLDSSDNLIAATDSQGQMLMVNQTLLKFWGRPSEAVLGQRRESFLPLRDAILQNEADQRVLRSGESVTVEEVFHVGGAQGAVEFLTRKFPLFDAQGLIYGVGGISTDITDLKDQQRQSRLSESVFVTAAEAIIVTDPDTRILRVNPAFTQQSGFSESTVLGHRTNILKSGRQDMAFYQTMWQALNEQGRWAGEISNRMANGSYYTVWSNINVVRDAQGRVTHYIAVQTDLTPLREAESQVQRMASFDTLTGLPNRALFNDRIGQLIAYTLRHRTTFALLFMDLDHFKEVNDSLGHQVGDELLVMIAKRLQAGVRTEDTVARMGGDEFVVLLPLTDRDSAEVVANNLLAQLRLPMMLGKTVSYQPMASAGIAVYPDDGDTPDLLLRNADMAMYEAKLSGRNRSAVYTLQMSQDSAHAFAIQTELAAAIAKQELRVYYQPKFRLDTGTLVGAEALVRWERPGHGLVVPVEFISIAEKSGLLVAVDQWVLGESLWQLGQWRRAGLWADGWRLAVNQNVSDLRRPAMLQELKNLLCTHQLEATALELEITEDALLDHTPELLERLGELRQLGVNLAIDDFGTGYSSLSYLRRLPIAVIKIDQSFISDMLLNDDDLVLVQTIIAMAKNLGHTLVAEGVETPQQRDRLADLGCDVGQGYLFGKPMPADEFATAYLGGVQAPGT